MDKSAQTASQKFLILLAQLAEAIIAIAVFMVVFNLLIEVLSCGISFVAVHVFHYPKELFYFYWFDMGILSGGGLKGVVGVGNRFLQMLCAIVACWAVYALRKKTFNAWRVLKYYAATYGIIFVFVGNYGSFLQIANPYGNEAVLSEYYDWMFFWIFISAAVCAFWRYGNAEEKSVLLPVGKFLLLWKWWVAGAVIAAAGVYGMVGDSYHEKQRFDTNLAAAENGDVASLMYIGRTYETSWGSSTEASLEWYRKAAEKGYLPAFYKIAAAYREGRGVKQDIAWAIDWYKKAAEKGHLESQLAIGDIYASSYPGKYWREQAQPANYPLAVKWFRMAAEQGSAEAQNMMGWLYDNGSGVKQDHAEAFGWYRKAAEKGFDAAQFNLGVAYEQGHGVPQDFTKAYYYYYLASVSGYIGALGNAKRLSGKFVEKDLLALQQRARDAWTKPSPAP